MKNTILVWILFLLFASCSEKAFVPASQNVPIFTGKKQWRIDQVIGDGSFDVGVAYSPINHLGTMLNFQTTLKGYSIEPGVGGFVYFKPLVLELYGGYAYVNKQHEYMWEELTRVNMKANRYFVQPSIGFHFNDFVDCAISAKASYWAFTKYEHLQDGYYQYASLASINNMRSLTIEPVFTLKAGTETFKGMMQAGFYYNPTEGITSPDIYLNNTSPWFLKIGCTIYFQSLPKEGDASHDNVRYF